MVFNTSFSSLPRRVDLKPENILLSFDHDTERCVDLKLCDFGLSTKFKSKVTLSDFCGSPGR